MYMDLLAKVSRRRRISVLLLSYSLVEVIGVLQPTPLCHIAYETLLRLRLALSRCLLWVGLVEDDLAPHQLAPPTALPAGSPEELVLPLLEMVGFVYEGQQARENPYAVEGIPFRRKLRVGEGGVVAQHDEARGDGQDQRLEIG
jgi:hypothetical protein